MAGLAENRAASASRHELLPAPAAPAINFSNAVQAHQSVCTPGNGFQRTFSFFCALFWAPLGAASILTALCPRQAAESKPQQRAHRPQDDSCPDRSPVYGNG